MQLLGGMLRWINMHSRRLMTLGDRRTWNNLNILSTCITEPQWTRRAYLAVCLGGKIHTFYLPIPPSFQIEVFFVFWVFFISPEFIFMRHNQAVSPPTSPHPKLHPHCTEWLSSSEVPLSCCCVVRTICTSWAEDAELTQPAAVTKAAHVWHLQCHLSVPACSGWGSTGPVLGRRKVSCLKNIPNILFSSMNCHCGFQICPKLSPATQIPDILLSQSPQTGCLGSSECLILLERW